MVNPGKHTKRDASFLVNMTQHACNARFAVQSLSEVETEKRLKTWLPTYQVLLFPTGLGAAAYVSSVAVSVLVWGLSLIHI